MKKNKKAIPKSSSSNDKRVITFYIMLVTSAYFSYKRYKYKILEGKKPPNFFLFILHYDFHFQIGCNRSQDASALATTGEKSGNQYTREFYLYR